MEEKATKTTKPKTTTKRSTAKKTTAKAKAIVEETKEVVATPQPSPMEQLLSQMTPEMMAELVKMVSLQNQPQTTLSQEPVKSKKASNQRISKAYLNSIREEEVEVRSVSAGTVVFKSPKTGMTYKWTGKDEVEVMTVGEVVSMHNASKKFLTTPWLVTDHEELNEGLGLQEVSETLDMIDDLDDFLALPIQEIKATIEDLPKTYHPVLAEQIGVKVSNGEIRDYILIRELEKLLNKEFIID